MPAASVELKGEAGSRRVAGGGDGSFRFESLEPGGYVVVVDSPGLASIETAIELSESVTDFVVVLSIEEQAQTIEVSAEATSAPDPASNADSVEISQEDLQALPAMDGDVIGTLQGLLDEGGVMGEGGGLVVDGMETDDLGVTDSAIQEVRINKDPYSAEYSRPGRSRIEVITKKGASDYHGQVNMRMRDHRLDARNAFAEQRPEQRRRGFEGHLLGPIGKGGNNSFLVSAEHDRDRQQAIIFAQTPEGERRDVVLKPEVETELSVRYNRHASYERALSLRFEWERESERNDGIGGFSLPEVASDQIGSEKKVYWSYRRIFGTTTVVEWSGRVGREGERETSLNPGPRIVVNQAFTSGGAQQDSESREFGAQSTAVASWQRGRHFVRAGFQLRDVSREKRIDRGNFGGTFRFASLADFAANRPFAYSRREGDPALAFWDVETAVFLQDNIKLNDRTVFALGMRYDRQNYAADPDNFAPRASLAFSLGENRRTTIRTGGGIFYDNLGSGAIRDRLRFDGVRLRELLITNPGYPDPLAAGELVAPPAPNLVRWAPDILTPYLGQFGVSVERKLDSGLTLALNWSRSVGVSMLRSRDLNAPLPGTLTRPDESAAIIRQLESSARLEADRISAQARGRIGGFLSGMARYTWGRAYNNVEDDDELPANSLDLSREWGPAGFDRRHRLDLLGALEVPKLFKVGFIYQTRSGRPYTITTGLDANGDGLTSDRPLGVGRNTERGPGSSELDVRFSRSFETPSLPGKEDDPTKLTLTLDAFNVLNQVNLGSPVSNMSSPLFGQATSASSARRLQAGLRWSF